MLKSFLNKIAGLKGFNFVKKRLKPSLFLENIVKSLRTAFVIGRLWWLLLHCELPIFINIEIVGKLKYTNGLQLVTSLKSELLHRYLLFPFFAGTSILNIFI